MNVPCENCGKRQFDARRQECRACGYRFERARQQPPAALLYCELCSFHYWEGGDEAKHHTDHATSWVDARGKRTPGRPPERPVGPPSPYD